MTPEARVRVRAVALAGLAGLAVGVLDLADAFLFFFAYRHVPPLRICQSIASGLLGRDAYQGGQATAALGVALHFAISFAIAATYALLARRVALLRTRPVACGLAYGVAVYFFMNQVVLPLSAFPPRAGFTLAPFLNGVIGHALLVGLPAAWITQRARPPVGAVA